MRNLHSLTGTCIGRRVRIWLPVLVMAACSTTAVRPIRAEVFHSRESALRLAFAEADTVATRDIFLGSLQVERVEALSGSRLPSRLLTAYVGRRGDETLGFAFFETHKVRSLPETIMVVIGTDGRILGVHLLAFHEPAEYQPPDRWIGQFKGRELDDELALRKGVAGIGGSTLTATAITSALRRVLATWEVALAPSVPVASDASLSASADDPAPAEPRDGADEYTAARGSHELE